MESEKPADKQNCTDRADCSDCMHFIARFILSFSRLASVWCDFSPLQMWRACVCSLFECLFCFDHAENDSVSAHSCLVACKFLRRHCRCYSRYAATIAGHRLEQAYNRISQVQIFAKWLIPARDIKIALTCGDHIWRPGTAHAHTHTFASIVIARSPLRPSNRNKIPRSQYMANK